MECGVDDKLKFDLHQEQRVHMKVRRMRHGQVSIYVFLQDTKSYGLLHKTPECQLILRAVGGATNTAKRSSTTLE